MADLIGVLESFNRKERFFLVGQALGNPRFKLSRDFRTRLGKAVGLEENGIKIPANAFAAMDYHLDWVAASLFLAFEKPFEPPTPPIVAVESDSDAGTPLFLNDDGIFLGNQYDLTTGEIEGETYKLITGGIGDVDLLVAFPSAVDGKLHLIFVEAKAYSPWTNKQLKPKAGRLQLFFNRDGNKYSQVKPHFCLMSGSRPNRLQVTNWPKWMKGNTGSFNWLELTLPSGKHKVERCNESQEADESGKYFHCPAVLN